MTQKLKKRYEDLVTNILCECFFTNFFFFFFFHYNKEIKKAPRLVTVALICKLQLLSYQTVQQVQKRAIRMVIRIVYWSGASAPIGKFPVQIPLIRSHGHYGLATLQCLWAKFLLYKLFYNQFFLEDSQ